MHRSSRPSTHNAVILLVYVIIFISIPFRLLSVLSAPCRFVFAEKQDRVPAFSNSEAFAVVESELGVPFGDVYELVEPEPIAAASIGQASTELISL